MEWIRVSSSQGDHETFAADVGDGVLIRHVELGGTSFGTGIVGVQLVFVPCVSVRDLLPAEALMDRSDASNSSSGGSE